MLKKVILIYLSVFLVVLQLTHGSKIASSSSEESSKELNAAVSERDGLYMYALEATIGLGNATISDGKLLFSNMLKDASIAKAITKTNAIRKHVEKLEDFVERVDKCMQQAADEQTKEIFALVVEYSDIVIAYNATMLKNPTEDILFMDALLKKYDYEQVSKNFMKSFAECKSKFNVAYDKYMSSLTSEQKSKEIAMMDWHKKFMAAQDDEKQVEIFSQFFVLYANNEDNEADAAKEEA